MAALLLTCSLVSCRHTVGVMQDKMIAPEVIDGAQEPTSWYSYLPERAPGYCLRTERAFIWQEPDMELGYWRGLHPNPPHRVLMEARGDMFILHRHYLWDGMTVGVTLEEDLLPSLRHDALYHALKEGAPFSRREADRAFLRDMRRAGVACAGLGYGLVRCFGSLFIAPAHGKTMLVQEISPTEPAAPLEEPTERELRAVNPLPAEVRVVPPAGERGLSSARSALRHRS